MVWFVGITLILSILGNVFMPYFLTKLHQKEKKDLHNRLMSRDYPDYKMAQDYDLELRRKEAEIEHEVKKKKFKEEKVSKEDMHRKNLAAQL